MKIIQYTYRYSLTPKEKQKVLLDKHFGCVRFVYNYFLNERKEKYQKYKQSSNYYAQIKTLIGLKKKKETKWLKEVNSQTLQQALRNLDTAYVNFFRGKTKFPKFKSKKHKNSFTVPQCVKVKNDRLYIYKFKEGIKINLHRPINGKIKHCTVSKSPAGKYFVSILCEVEYKAFKKTGKQVGIDTGIKDFAILSDGTTYENIKILKNNLKKLQYQQRQLSKKQKGSNSRKKQRKNIAVLHEKITNIRKDYLHKVSTEIIKNHDVISVEDLAVKNIIKNHCLAQAISDVSLGIFYKMLEYKAHWNDRLFVKIDRFFPSSKTCSHCGWINQNLTLSVREWDCPSCKTTLDRDINAAKNILKQGLDILSGSGIESYLKQKRVEALPLGKSMKPEAYLSLTNG